ncbi:MAG: 50S ribosomal protein L22 [Patescibacteria group bacterium]|mgnify:FL=1
MKASLINYKQAPRKVRLLADLVRGKTVAQALLELSFTDKRASEPMCKLIASAAANAEKNFDTRKESLFIKEIRVDKGLIMRRFMPRARGRATPIRHRTSHVNVLLAVKDETPVAKKTTKKVVTKKETTKKAK